jgi:hypothetical protein
MDVRQDCQLALFDLLVVDLPQLEGEGLDEMGLLDGRKAPVEQG